MNRTSKHLFSAWVEVGSNGSALSRDEPPHAASTSASVTSAMPSRFTPQGYAFGECHL